MLNDSRYGLFDLVIVHKLDRFARNRYDSAISRKILRDNGVELYSVIEKFDNTPESIILEGLMETLNEYYSANLSREVMKGMRETPCNAGIPEVTSRWGTGWTTRGTSR